jgi:hypothetical protein
MSSFCPDVMDAAPPGESRFPGLAEFREQAQLLAGAGADLIALQMIGGRDYGSAAVQAATETGLPVWLGVSPYRRADGALGTVPDFGAAMLRPATESRLRGQSGSERRASDERTRGN